MDENAALRRENDSLREQNRELLRRVVGAEDVMAALARGEVDAVTVGAIETPLLLHAAQDDLRRSKALMRAIFDGALDAMLLADDDGVYLDANPAACDLFGATRDHLLGHTLAELVGAGSDRDAAQGRLLTHGRTRAQFALQRADGTERTLEYSAVANVSPGLHLSVLRDITERVEAEGATRESHRRLQEAQAIAHVGSWTSGFLPDGTIQWSSEGARILGIPDDTPMAVAAFFDSVHPEDHERFQRAVRDAIDHGAAADVEHRILRPDGGVRWIHQRGTIERGADGRPVRMVGTVQDVTERHLALDALRTSEAEFRLLAEAMPQVVWITLPDGSNAYFNQRWMDYTGLTLEESLGDGWLRPFHPEDAHAAREAWRAATASAGSYSIECRLRRADGVYCWWLIRGAPVFDANDNVLKWFGTCTDVNDIKLSEARLRESEAMLRFTGHTARLGGWHVSFPDRRLTWSDEVCRIHELPAGSAPTVEQAVAFYAPEFRQTIREKVEACVREGVPFDVELQIITSTGRRVWVRVLGEAERNSSGAVTMVRGAFQDVDDRRKLQEQYRQAQKMEAIGRLAGGVAHDFNNALSVILSYSEMIVGDLDHSDPMRDDVEEIRKAGARAAAFTHQLLIFSRQQVVEPKVLDLNDVLSGMDKMLRRILGEDVDLTSLPDRSLGRVNIDPSSLDQVVMNLVVNARDAMPTGGRLTIETSNVDLDADFVRDNVGASLGPHVMLAVSDTGIGMDKATQARIFEPFFTTKDRDKGTGLGLSTVYGVARQSGGIVLVSSEPGKGTSFRVYLPRVDGAVDKPHAHETLGRPRGTETILLVEDEEQVRVVASSILRKQGYRILEARHAGEALLLSERHADDIHLLLTDVVMPQMSGPELAKRLAPLRPQMKLLCMSGYTDDSIMRHGVLRAEIAYLQKPITPQTLTRKVREVLDAPAHSRRTREERNP